MQICLLFFNRVDIKCRKPEQKYTQTIFIFTQCKMQGKSHDLRLKKHKKERVRKSLENIKSLFTVIC